MSVIIPSSEDVPGASHMEIIGTSAVRQIESMVAAQQTGRSVNAGGFIAVDESTQRAHGRRFVDLADDERTEVVAHMDALARRRVDPSRSGLARRLTHAVGMWRGQSAVVEFYEAIRADALEVFYASEIAWLWLDMYGPPMPLGYESLETARSPRRVPPLTAMPSVTRHRTADITDSADVVVVGSGAGGAVVAKELSEAGLSVIVIVAGATFLSPIT